MYRCLLVCTTSVATPVARGKGNLTHAQYTFKSNVILKFTVAFDCNGGGKPKVLLNDMQTSRTKQLAQ